LSNPGSPDLVAGAEARQSPRQRRALRGVAPWKKALASGLLSGYSPVAPGTAGSFVALAVLWLACPSGGYVAGPALFWLLAASAGVLAGGWWLASQVEPAWGKDSKRVVVDEFLGQALAVAMLPREPVLWVAAFIAFRALDVVKPFPARRLENLAGGAGVMADDIVAGVYANICVQLLRLAGL
jgi:phosphatidylglycerophosphatase A